MPNSDMISFLEYTRQMTSQLAIISNKFGLNELGYYLGMATLEAHDQIEKKPGFSKQIAEIKSGLAA